MLFEENLRIWVLWEVRTKALDLICLSRSAGLRALDDLSPSLGVVYFTIRLHYHSQNIFATIVEYGFQIFGCVGL